MNTIDVSMAFLIELSMVIFEFGHEISMEMITT